MYKQFVDYFYTLYGYDVPGIFRRLCIDVVGPLVGHNIQCILLLMIVHYLPAESRPNLRPSKQVNKHKEKHNV